MKPTTMSVFESPVRPSTGQSRRVQGSSGRAAGAHAPGLPAAQEGQTKSSPGRFGGTPGLSRACRHFRILAILLLLGPAGFAFGEDDPGKTPFSFLSDIFTSTGDVSQASVEDASDTIVTNPCISDEAGVPAMVVIRPGRFRMGSPNSEEGRYADEGPQHPVTIPRPFALSRCEITVGQFRKFVQESGYETSAEQDGKGCWVWNSKKLEAEQKPGTYWDKPDFSKDDDHPVVCVSWIDTQHYVDWLSQRTGALYRLPTEAEWEYAARGDTRTARYFGDKTQCDYANGLGQEAKGIAAKNWVLAECGDGYIYTAPVGTFKANPFGLYDMLGNALEWALDCWHESYTNGPKDGSAWLENDGGECHRRVVRGGSWGHEPRYLRSANRGRINSDVAIDYVGFRVARAL